MKSRGCKNMDDMKKLSRGDIQRVPSPPSVGIRTHHDFGDVGYIAGRDVKISAMKRTYNV